jgi:hypothetical protein
MSVYWTGFGSVSVIGLDDPVEDEQPETPPLDSPAVADLCQARTFVSHFRP